MSHPPIPQAEQSPAWHQYFVKAKDFLTSYISTTDERLEAIETQQAEFAEQIGSEADEEDWPIGGVALLAFSSSIILNANEKITVSGSSLVAPIFNHGGGSVLYLTEAGPSVAVGTWKLLNPPTATGNKGPYHWFNFKRIS